MDRKELLRLLQLKRVQTKRRAQQGSFIDMVKYCKSDYDPQWFHIDIANKLERFLADPDRKCLAIFMPPQHGKSELTTRQFPAYALGMHPDKRIAVCSYGSKLASKFNRAVQKTIDSENYFQIFPNTQINSKRVVSSGSWLRNNSEFEIVGKRGSLMSVGVGGSLSGNPVDIGIIDDPIKGMAEASSDTIKQGVWEWYLSVFSTRLHNGSKQILITTRWAEDDLGGRLLDPKQNPNWEDWEVVTYEAIKEEIDNRIDPRAFGEALWEGRHSLDKLTKLRSLDESIFSALYQQTPNTKEGSTIKRDWFEIVDDFPRYLNREVWVDTAYTKKKQNDPTGLLTFVFDESANTLYLVEAESVRLEMPELLKKCDDYKIRHNLNFESAFYIEPKASGLSTIQLINKIPNFNVPAVPIDSYLVKEPKPVKHKVSSTYIHSTKLKIVRGTWNKEYIEQMIKEKPMHDEYRDLTGYACEFYFRGEMEEFGQAFGMSHLI